MINRVYVWAMKFYRHQFLSEAYDKFSWQKDIGSEQGSENTAISKSWHSGSFYNLHA